MVDKSKIYYLYFIEKKNIVEIAKEQNVTKQAISKILKQFPEYHQEKERRKQENKIKHAQKTAEYIKQKRMAERANDEDYEAMKREQAQAAAALSRKGKLSDDALIKLCILHYDYNKEKERLVFNESAGKRPADLPRSVYVHKNVLKQFRA
ncbi:hypothetical protein [Thermoanaerobacter siderophilus]|uniref:Uncharacterized protein n=1 Tax=Thermoanaerobacter siderophilus SR4 TaxID=880478 RepID=I9KT22_9THEO|nr:hypothetical protein [Thermoanaerobacter siderophilus]EIV99960.1 hypothetical protein ThesiDRAFT1_0978 [Thermoanaerobacter siderophilus SR4]